MDLGNLNPVLTVSAVVWVSSELMKYLLGRSQDPNWKLFRSGGMPSVHTSVIVSAATVIALIEGMESPLFGLAVAVAAIVFHDAVRVRWAVGEQAIRINELSKQAKLQAMPVTRGHRIREAFAGAVYGGALAWLLYQVLYA